MTDSDIKTGEWKPVPGAGYYEVSHRGKVRSVDRTIGGKFYPGKEPLSTRLNNQGYVLVDIRLDDGAKKTCTMHSLVLRAHAGEPGPGQETLHGPGGPTDNRWPENIRWGTRPENLADMAAARPPRAPKPPVPCVNHARCGGHVGKGGRRCRGCVMALGRAAAQLIAQGTDLELAAGVLDYSSPVGLHRLAVKYGGLRCRVDPAAVTQSDGSRSPSRLRRVINRARAWLADSDTQ